MLSLEHSAILLTCIKCNRSWKPFLVFLRVAVLHRVYCIPKVKVCWTHEHTQTKNNVPWSAIGGHKKLSKWISISNKIWLKNGSSYISCWKLVADFWKVGLLWVYHMVMATYLLNGSLKVESIAECSIYFWPPLGDNLSWNPFFGLFDSGSFT